MPRGCLVVLATLAAFVPAQALARDAAPPLSGYSLASWTEREGIPLGVIRAIVQDREGYLWLGTDSGLLRFDGVRFSTADALGLTEMPSRSVRALLLARDGTLWIGFQDRGGVRALRQGRLQHPGRLALSGTVGALAEDDGGTVWAATSDGVFRFRGDTWDKQPLGDGDPRIAPGTLHIDRLGRIWVGTNLGLFRQAASGRFERVGTSESPVRAIAEDASGRIWVTDPTVAFREAAVDSSGLPTREASGLEIFGDRAANIWVGTAGQGVWRLRTAGLSQGPRLEAATVETGLISNGIWAGFEDREGNIWLGSQQGLTRLTPHTVIPLADIGVTRAVERGEIGVWAGTAGGLLHVTRTPQGPQARRVGTFEVVALHRDTEGTVWVASRTGLSRVRGGLLVPVTVTPQLAQIRSLAHTTAGLWVADGTRGLLRFSERALTPFALPAHLRARPIRFIHGDRRGRLWIAFADASLAWIDADLQVFEADARQGFAAGTHTTLDAIAEDAHGTIWIGGNRGLTRFRDGRFVSVGSEGGLPGDRVTAIATDASGYLWLASDGAVVRLHPDEFTAAGTRPGHRMRHTRLDTSDGVGGVPIGTVNERVASDAEGGLWFATGWGLTFVDPTVPRLHQPASELPALIEGALVNDARVAPDDGLALPAGTNAVRIDYTAIALTTPTRIRFRYRLEGFDSGWVDAGTRRQAFYTNLPPGNYRFVVQAEAGDRSWTNPSAAWAFAIEPRFHQTATFYAGTLLVVALAAWGTWQMRLRHERRQFALVLGERARLSREIHDTLLQNLAGVAIQCAGISNSLDDRSPARTQLNGVRRQVEDYLRDMRQAVWDLRAPILETHGLADALREFGTQLTAGTPIRFDLAVSGRPRRFPAKVENDVLRVAQEGIRNAVRHSNGTQVRVELLFGRDALTLHVSDNGRGFDVSHQASDDRHFGVLGMRERAQALGGRLRIATQPAGGTDLELVVPAAANPQEA